MRQDLKVNVNVRVLAYERQMDGSDVLVATRETHNIFTNTGRAWLARLLGAVAFDQPLPTPHDPEGTARVAYMGFGCGGQFQTATGFSANKQQELASVVALEDPAPISVSGMVATYLKRVEPQTNATVSFPDGGIGRTTFVCTLEPHSPSYINFSGARSRTTQQDLESRAPISEAGLYLSLADPTGDPTAPNYMICYDTFDPIVVTPNTVLRCEWEIRFG